MQQSLALDTYFLNLIEKIPGSIYWKDLKGRYLGCNRFVLEMAGLSHIDEIIGKTDFDMPWKDLAEVISATDMKVISSGVPVESEEAPILKNGKKIFMISNRRPLLNNKGETIGIVGTSIDITELKRTQEREKLYGERIAQVLSYLPVHLYWKDKNGFYLGCNLQQAQSLGFKSPEEIVGKTDLDITKDKKEAENFMRNDLDVIKNKKIKTMEENAVFEGKDSIVLSQKAPLYDTEGNVVGVVGTSIDITELKHAQEQVKLAEIRILEEKAKAEIETEKELRQAVMILAGSIAHDLRTPISVINLEGHSLQKSLAYLLKMYRASGDDKFTDSQLEDLEKTGDDLRKIAMQMHDYIEVTLKTLSRGLKGGVTQEDLVECSMWHCIHNTLTRYPFLDTQKDLVTWDQQDFNFMGNELLTIRIFSNLLTNALQQIQKNQKGAISITTEKATAGNIIRFKDTAGGAPPEITHHLFEGYKTTKEKGTGIGLAFCKMTLDSFGGSIQANSVEGDYMEFLITLPPV